MAARSLGTLTLDLVVKEGGFVKGMDRAARESEKRMKQIEATAKKIGIGIGAAFTAATAGLILFVKNQTDAIASYQDFAEKIGDTAEAVASLKAATDVSGTSFDTVAAASVRLTAALSKTDDEAKGVGNALKAIGLNLEDFKKLSPVEQIDAVAKALAGFEDGANKTAVAVALFGKAGAELLPFLNDLADGAERQTTLTQAQIDAANELQETLADLKGSYGTLKQQIAGEIIPVVLDVVKAFADVLKQTKLVAGDTGIRDFARSAALGFVSVIEFANRTIQTLNALRGSFQVFINDVRVLNKVAGFLNPASAVVGGGFTNQVESLRELLDERNKTLEEANQRYEDLVDTNFTKVSDALKKSFAEQENYVEKTKDLDRPELKFSGIPPEAEKNAKKAAKAVDEYATSLESARAIQEEVERLQSEQNKLLDEAAAVYDRTRTPLENFNAEIERLNKLRDTFVNGKPLIDDVTYRRAVVAAQDDLTGLGKKTEEVASEMTVFWEQAARNMQDAFADFLFDPFEKGLDGMLKSFADTLQRMAAEAAAAQLFKAFAGGLTGSGGFLDLILGIGGGLGGGGPPIGKRASGGPVMPGQTYLVGEKGPELFSPNGAGTIIPNDRMGGTTINVTVPVTAPTGSVGRPTLDQIQSAAFAGAQMAAARNR